MTGPWHDRTVTGHIPLSLDGRVTGPGGEHDMGWTARHAACGEARAQLLTVTAAATTALLGRRTYQGLGGFWPAVAGDESADPRDRAFARWLDEVEKVVVSRIAHRGQMAQFPGRGRRSRRDRSAASASARAETSSSWPATASSAACWRPASSTG